MPTRYTVLLAEDNPGDVFLVRRALEKQGLDVNLVIVEDGQAALQFIERADADPAIDCPDLILLDLNLPRASGNRVLTRLRQSPRCATTPIIVITSSDSPLDKESASRLGANEYFQKPVDLAGFMQIGRIVAQALVPAGSRVAGAPAVLNPASRNQ
jgi:two-component system, chemotaxis family, response regulator Rcp1